LTGKNILVWQNIQHDRKEGDLAGLMHRMHLIMFKNLKLKDKKGNA